MERASWIDDALRSRLHSGEATVGGVLSGTSADGIDVVLAQFPAGEGPRVLAFSIEPFPAELGARVRSALDGETSDLRAAALLHRDLGLAFGRAARRVADRSALTLELLGSHGQTVWHHDGVEPSGPATLQLGDGDFVAAAAGCAVVSDFRQADIAAGGEGAPLSALADGELFSGAPKPLAVLNLGGMANLTHLVETGEGLQSAFDVGPAGSLLDGLARRLLDAPLDEGGALAATGTAHEELGAYLLDHAFIEREPPKSTGRDTFGEPFVEGFLERAALLGISRPEDILASAVDAVARSVAEACTRFLAPQPSQLVVAGGGGRNLALLEALRRHLAFAVRTSAAHGIDPDAREALVFALLARRAALGLPSTHPGATGARKGRVLGKLSPG